MPHTVTHEIKARYLQKGDVVVMPHTEVETGPLQKVDKKQKYVWIADESGKEGRLGMNDNIEIKRVEDTEEEKAAKRRASQLDRFTRTMTSVISSWELAKQQHIDRITSQGYIDFWVAQAFAETQERYFIWLRVQKVMENKEIDVLEAVKLVAGRKLEELLSSATGSGRSTSQMSNAFEDVKLNQAAKFVRDVQDMEY